MAVGRPPNRSLFVAIAVSVAVHLVVLFVPAWRLPTDDTTTLPPLDARLVPLPKPTVVQPDDTKRVVLGDAPPPRPRPKRKKPARPAEPQVSSGPVAQLSPEPENGAGTTDDEGKAVAPTPEAATPEPEMPSAEAGEGKGGADNRAKPAPTFGELWAASGKIQYDVIRGERNFIVGRTTHAWTHDAEHYSMETVIETSGLVGLINTLAIEGAKYNITANAVAPLAATRMTADIAPQELLDRLDPDLVAPAVGYLCSEQNHDTASVFVVGGGLVQRVAQFQNDGVTFPGAPSLDEISGRWAEISDMTNAKPGTNPV